MGLPPSTWSDRKPMTEGWVRFDQYEDVLASTDLLALVAPSLREQPSSWKWMIIAAHNGLQGALVCAIRDTSGTNVLKERSAKAKLTWLANPAGTPPHERLDDFIPLLKKYRKKYPCCGTIQQLRQIHKLHSEFRNNFVHFVPKGWSIELAMLPAIIRTGLDLIEAAMQQHQVAIHLDEGMQRRLQQNLTVAREHLPFLGRL
jgi:hypothetical protein